MKKGIEESRTKMIKKLSEIFQEYKRKKKWKRAFAILATLVILITGYTLILPAITMEKKVAVNEKIVPMEVKTKEETRKEIEDTDKDVGIDIKGKESDSEKENLLNKENEKEEDKNKNQEKPLEKKEEAKTDEKKEEKIEEEKVGEEKKEEEKDETKKGLKSFAFKDNKNGIKGRVEIKEGQLPEGSILKVEPIKKEKKTKNKILRLFSLSKTLDEKDSKEEELEKKSEKIEESIDGKIEEILFYDISFFTPEGDYLPVGEEAKITLDLSEENLSKKEGETITIGHFQGDQLELLDAQVGVNTDDKIEEISFDTEGFSVFAIIKHETWTEARLPEDEYTIITPVDGSYKAAKSTGKDKFNPTDLEGQELPDQDREPRPGGQGTERPFQFKNLEAREKYDRFLISKNPGNLYHIKDLESNLYLSLDTKAPGNLSYVGEAIKSDFKFYINSKEPEKFMIHTVDKISNKPYFLVYDKGTK